MFEVEQKFNLTADERVHLLTDAKLKYIKSITDRYYDTFDYKLTLRDYWLRERDGKFELKIPIDMTAESIVDQYREIEDESGICDALGFSSANSLSECLKSNHYLPFCTCITNRESYLKDEFTIVLDHVTYADCDLTFDACEIELLVAKVEDMPSASKRIAEFATAQGLKTEYLHGKVMEYLYHQCPEHFESLVKAGVVLAPAEKLTPKP